MNEMTRPCFLVVDREYAGSISTRKLVIETAKLNVVTAYSGAEALATMKRFPALDGVVLDAGVTDLPCEEVVRGLKAMNASMPVVVVGTPSEQNCDAADYFLRSFEPAKLLDLLSRIEPGVKRIESSEDDLREGKR